MNLSQIKILHIDSNHPLLWKQLQQAGFHNEADFTSSKQEIEAKIENYHGIVIRSRFKIDKTFLDKATNLQFIARVGAGLESIDCDYATAKGIHLIAAPEGNANATQVSLSELQEKSDVLSLHTPWTPETDKMVNADFINKFKKPFWFINTARGNSVVTKDLVEALQSGKILGAGLDVLEYEKLSFETLFEDEKPVAFEYLLQAKNVLLTPHIAGWTFESHQKLAQTIVDKIKRIYAN